MGKMKKRFSIILIAAMVFTSFQGVALAAATTFPKADDKSVIKLTEDVTLSDTYEVKKGEEITLDLNGFTVSMEKKDLLTKNHEMILNSGKLTIMDSSEKKSGKLVYNYTGADTAVDETGKDGFWTNTITNDAGGSLTVNGGTIENLTVDKGTHSATKGFQPAYVIYSRTNGDAGNATVEINEGKITGKKDIGIYGFVNSLTCTNTVIIKGGVFETGFHMDNDAKLEITGGRFKTDITQYVTGENAAVADGKGGYAVGCKVHTIVSVAEIAAKCDAEGTKAHYACEKCDFLFTDKDGNEMVFPEDLAIPVLEHVYIHGLCTVCQKEDPDYIAPQLKAPANLKASNVASSGKVKVTWDAVEGADEYMVYRGTTKDGAYTKMLTTTGTSYTNTSAKAGTTYYYKVKAATDNKFVKNSVFSEAVMRTCDLARPSVKATNVAKTGKVKLTWSKVSGANKYKVYRATSKEGKYTLLKTVTGTSFTNTSAVAGKAYYYKVKAVMTNKSAATSAYSTVDKRTCDLARPNVSVKSKASKQITLSWKKVSGAKKYTVYRATSKNGKYTKVITTTKTSYTNKNRVSGKYYYYKVKAVPTNTAATSAYSLVDKCKAK